MDKFDAMGFCIVPGALSTAEVASLRSECLALNEEHKARGRNLLDSGCVMDLFRDVQISDSNRCRTDAGAYVKQRSAALNAVLKSGKTCLTAPPVDPRAVVFGKLAGLAARVLPVQEPKVRVCS